MKKQILILEDEIIIANGIMLHLNKNGYECEIATHPKEAEKLLETHQFSAIISDINLNNEISGIDFIEKHIGESRPVIFLTAYSDMTTMKQAEQSKPYAYLMKPFNKNHLLIMLNLAIANFRKKFIHQLPEDIDIENLSLSKRELEILNLVAKSKTTDEISEILCISPATVSTHRKNIFRKTGAKSLIELISLSIEKEWI
ncbi:MAG: response regulator transcription factor [Flavobacteriia bacterium]|nr:response regulator transcription factor [Flavobacteriia bacterium]